MGLKACTKVAVVVGNRHLLFVRICFFLRSKKKKSEVSPFIKDPSEHPPLLVGIAQ